jgi:F-type H+-transporting ATPase subunit delta
VDAVAQLKALEELIAGSPDLHAVLLTPAVQTSRKRAVIGKLAGEMGLSPLIRNFLFIVLDHKRVGQLTEIRQAFETQLDKQLGFVRAEVTSAEPLDQVEGTAIEAELARLSGMRMRMHFEVDPDLLGGVVARIGSTVYDGSIRGQLDRMRRQFAGESGN